MPTKSQQEHTRPLEGNETYTFKLKDHPEDRRGVLIHDPMGGIMHLKEIRIVKYPNSNNRFMVELVKDDKNKNKKKPNLEG